MLKSKSLSTLFAGKQKQTFRLRVVFDNPESRATPFTFAFSPTLTVKQLKKEIIRQERLRGRGDLFELVDDEELLLSCIRLYKTSIDVGAESQFRQHNKQLLQKTSILSYFSSTFVGDDDMPIKTLMKDGSWLKNDNIIHMVARVVPYANDTLTLLATFQDDISIEDNTPPIVIDADGEWSLRKLKQTLIQADGRPINPSKALLYASDCTFSPSAEKNTSIDTTEIERAAKVPLRVESLKVSNFFPPKSDLDKISIIISFDIKELPPKVRYIHPRQRFIFDPLLTKREKATKWKPATVNARGTSHQKKTIEKSNSDGEIGGPGPQFLSLPQLDFSNSSHVSTPTEPQPHTPTDGQSEINRPKEEQYGFLNNDTDTSTSLALALASLDRPLVI
ncbi:hypothetical protein E3Q23_04180 [Wallemia mellicola]|uniref:Uncharacterized protein n=1 Tax=Wallemia mellicola TaxID=1708541 RepID=A0A4T0NRL5_9BASI|nr:hypothetical protein E3Q24_04139 [Wallemia mellicola]TIB70420.1 hypothetical protein E3Q23_04180 [Wallemia mellicola]TIB79337.1 hypothetical protein E3Q21_04174 [Wallemia mellicola]TIB83465.1 hypothetical protein E3Q20_04145 [Wallemia mellicola]TIB99427.1 hypothetical protein E3Q16_04184 [Wallemia mellicola]